jgi:putative tricarboxylic transport membrane protein
MMIVLQYQGIVVGPRLFQDSPNIAYGVFVMMTVTYLLMIPLILPLRRYASKVVTVPVHVIVPLILGLTVVGAFADREYMFDMASPSPSASSATSRSRAATTSPRS